MSPARRPARQDSAATATSDAAQIAAFIAKFDPAHATLIRAVRRALRERFPTAFELVYDNYIFLVFGFCASARASSCIVSLAAAANGVGLSFYRGATLPDPDRILLGQGKQNRFVRVPSVATLDEPAVEALFAAAVAQSDPPLPATGHGPTIVKSISAKQRPRRK